MLFKSTTTSNTVQRSVNLTRHLRRMIRKFPASLALVGVVSLPVCSGQAVVDTGRAAVEGVRLYSVSSFFGYSAFDLPQTAAAPVTLAVRSRKMFGATGSLGWQRFHGRTNFSFRYSGTYSRDIRDTNLNRFGHTALLNLTRPFGSKWTLDVSANGQEASFDQFVFEPSALGSISQAATSTEDLAAAMAVGQFTSPQSALLLSGSTAAASPTRAVLLGSDVLSYGAHAGLAYAATSRLRFTFGSFAVGGQHRTGDSVAGASQKYILPRAVGGEASVSMDYLLSSRTTLDFSMSQHYMSTAFQKSSGSSAIVGFGRKMGRRWFLRTYGGASFVEHLQGSTSTPQQLVAGGSLGVTTDGNTLVASYTRSGHDINAGAIGTNSVVAGAWNWRRPRSSWGLNASYSRTQNTSTGILSVSGWQAAAAMSKRLPGNLFVSFSYTHLSSQGLYLSLANRIAVDGARISLGWAPRHRMRNTPTPGDDPNDH
jgi:hypothetical protein